MQNQQNYRHFLFKNDKFILKSNPKYLEYSKQSSKKKKNQLGGPSVSDYKSYCKVI